MKSSNLKICFICGGIEFESKLRILCFGILYYCLKCGFGE